MPHNKGLPRRRFLSAAGATVGAAALGGCSERAGERYTQADIDLLARQREQEAASKGKGPYGKQVYAGYRGLAELPWFELDDNGELVCVDDTIPYAIDVHAHLGMSVLFKPQLDLLARTPRTKHLLDCDATNPGCDLDLDIYINGNFTEDALDDLAAHTLGQGLWGSKFARTHTIPNLLREMDAMRVQQALLLPIKLGLPFGDTLTEDWRRAVMAADAGARLRAGLSVFPSDLDAITKMRQYAKSGARIMKLHPTVQQFYPDDIAIMDIYDEAERLGLVIFYHGGRAGIEPESRHRYAMPRHYELPLRDFPKLQFILGHAGARDADAMLQLATRYDNAWLGLHGQGVTHLEKMIQVTGGERLLFGTDWPFYHLGASLAKVLIVTNKAEREKLRADILRENALRLFPELG
jgi:hypothetical protein